MQIATLINAHKSPDVVKETIDSVKRHVTDKIVLVIDHAGWHEFENFSYEGVKKICGFRHHARFSPYKNVALGMNYLYNLYPSVDWYNYIEYDVLYLNDNFKIDLEKKSHFSMLGFVHQKPKSSQKNDHWLAKKILHNQNIKGHKMLGAVAFYSHYCMERLMSFNFFEELLKKSRPWRSRMPNFYHVAVEEILFPSAARMTVENQYQGINLVQFTPDMRSVLAHWSLCDI
jgi:hypothetical protein